MNASGPLRNQRPVLYLIGLDFLKVSFEFERPNRIEPERTHTPQSLAYRACTYRSESEEVCEEQFILPIHIVAIPTEIAEAVRATLRAPVYGFPAHAEAATDAAPCRHCLRAFVTAKTAEFSLPMIASRESSRFLSPARSMFTRKLVSVIRSTPDFPRSFAKARALSRPTHTAAGFWPRNTWRMSDALGIQGVSLIPSHRQLPHFTSFHPKLRLDRPGAVVQSPVDRLQTNHLGSTLGRAPPLPGSLPIVS